MRSLSLSSFRASPQKHRSIWRNRRNDNGVQVRCASDRIADAGSKMRGLMAEVRNVSMMG
jgi:hypothetical protein